jgi:hypothetical protein
MKKILATLAILMIAFTANAEGLIIKGGFSYTHLDLTQKIKDQAQQLAVEARNYSGFHAGIGYQTESFSGFTLQPELLFLSKKGNNFGDNYSWSLSYLELPINIQWGIDLVALRPFVQLSPYVGYNIKNRPSAPKDASKPVMDFLTSFTQDPNRFSYGIGIGGGIEIMRRFQVSAQYVWNFGHVISAQQYIDSATNATRDKAAGLELSLGLMF